jgi:hypothetical protein
VQLSERHVDGVDVEQQAIGPVERTDAAIPRVHFKAAEVHKVNERRQVLAQEVIQLLARTAADARGRDPFTQLRVFNLEAA